MTSIACLSTVLTAGTAKMGLFALPHFPRLRIMMFITVFTVIFTVFILFLNISHLYTFFPVDYGKMVRFFYDFQSNLFTNTGFINRDHFDGQDTVY